MSRFPTLVSVSSALILKRNPECIPQWVADGPCVGDCRNATQPIRQSNCGPPYTSQTSCKAQMPCFCYLADLQLDFSVVTCGDCRTITEGQHCNFKCLDSSSTFEGLSRLTCLNTGWDLDALALVPTCVTRIPTCPPLASSGGINIDLSPSSRCVGAIENQVCRFNCLPYFYNSEQVYETTCTLQPDGSLNWSRQPRCDCQTCPGDIPCFNGTPVNVFGQ